MSAADPVAACQIRNDELELSGEDQDEVEGAGPKQRPEQPFRQSEQAQPPGDEFGLLVSYRAHRATPILQYSVHAERFRDLWRNRINPTGQGARSPGQTAVSAESVLRTPSEGEADQLCL